MKALAKLYDKPGIWMTDVAEPECGSDEVKIKVKYNAICGTDNHIFQWDSWAQKTIPIPMVVGHEFMGEVVEIGELVTNVKVGDRVSAEGHLICGHCRNCRAGRFVLCPHTLGVGVNRTGAFAEYLTLPSFNVFKLASYIPDKVAAFFDAFGNATHTAFTFNLVGEDVLVTGAGPIGIMAALIAQRIGAKNVALTDVNPYRLDLARKAGVKHCYDISKTNLKAIMADLDMNEGFDVGLEMSGNPIAFKDMLLAMINGGSIALLGIPSADFSIDWNLVVFKMLRIQGIYGRQIFDTWYQMSSLVKQGFDISALITHEYSIDNYEAAFDTMASGLSGRVLMKWD